MKKSETKERREGRNIRQDKERREQERKTRKKRRKKRKKKEGGENELFIPDCSCNIKSNLERHRREVERVWVWGGRWGGGRRTR